MVAAKIQKYFVNRKDAVTIQCRRCGRMKTVSVERLKDKKHLLSINCPCTETFAVTLEFRHDFRQKTNISCSFRALSTPRIRARRGIIADQSNGGLLLHITEEVPIKKDDQVIVSYRPDRRFPQEIEKTLRVRHYEPGHSIGGAFADAPQPQKVPAGRSALL